MMLNSEKHGEMSKEMKTLSKKIDEQALGFDSQYQLKLLDDVKAVFDKNNTYDIFQHAVLSNGEYMFEPMLDKKRLQLKL